MVSAGTHIKCAAGYLWSVSVRSTDDAFASFVSSTASDRKGFVKGESVPLDRVLPTFARTKVGPRREGVLTTPLQKAARRRRRSQTGPCRVGEIKPNHSLCRQSLRLISFATSLYTREAFGWCDAEGEKKLCCSLCWQPLSQPYGCQPLAAARSRRGSDMPLAYHSLPRRHFVTPCTGEPLG